MRQLTAWSAKLGHWGPTQVRVHVLLVVVSLALVLLGIAPDGSLAWQGPMLAAVLWLSVLLHELAHVAVAGRLGGRVEVVVLGPVGGMHTINAASQPKDQLVTTLAGPLANLSVCLLVVPLWLLERAAADGQPGSLWLGSIFEATTVWASSLKIVFWVNAMLVAINLLPATPLDGGRILRSLLWQGIGYRNAVLATAVVGKVTAVVLCVVAWGLRHHAAGSLALPGGTLPVWVVLLAAGVMLYFSARWEVERLRQRELSEEWLGYDFSESFNEERRDPPQKPRPPGPLRRWLDRQRRARYRRRQLIEEEEEWRVDDILARLHEFGMDSLSPSDRSILQRVSARYRARMQDKSSG